MAGLAQPGQGGGDQRLLRFVIAPVKERLGEFDADEASNGAQTGIKDGIRMTKSAKQLLLLSWADTGRQRQIQPAAKFLRIGGEVDGFMVSSLQG